jgi:hypothetical protein
VIVAPPFNTGAVNETTADAFPATALTPVGTPGTVWAETVIVCESVAVAVVCPVLAPETKSCKLLLVTVAVASKVRPERVAVYPARKLAVTGMTTVRLESS